MVLLVIVRRPPVVRYAATAAIGRVARDGAVSDREGAMPIRYAAARITGDGAVFDREGAEPLDTPPSGSYCLRWCCF